MRKESIGIQKYYFSVDMNYAECESLYRQQIKFLLVTDHQGKRIQLPKQNMQKFVTASGIKGNFELQVDKNHKMLSISLV